MARPRLFRCTDGLSRQEIADHLRTSYRSVRRWQEEKRLPAFLDPDGQWRSTKHDVAEFCKKTGRTYVTDGETVARIYEFFREPGFTLTNDSIGRIVVQTREHPDEVVALWLKYHSHAAQALEQARAVTPAAKASREATRYIQEASDEYEQQIAAMEERFGGPRRGVSFIAGGEPPKRRAAEPTEIVFRRGPGLAKSAANDADEDAAPDSRTGS